MRPCPLPLLAALLLPATFAAAAPQRVGAWLAAPDGAGPTLPAATIRQVVRPTIGGSGLRIVLSNEYGKEPLKVGAARIAVSGTGADTVAGTDRALTFGGAASVTLPPGGRIVSDDVPFDVQALRDLSISLWLPSGSPAPTIHGAGMRTAWIAQGTDATARVAFPAGTTDDSRYFIAGLEVEGSGGAVVALGDSIVDGIGATQDAEARWSDVLARRLQAAGVPLAVLNGGIAGNRVVRDAARPFVGPSALHRLDRDALDQPGVRWIVLAHGINDIAAGDMLADPAERVSVAQLVDGLRKIVLRAHARNVRECGTTLLPYEGVGKPFVHTAAAEAARQEVNAWIRSGGAFDAVADTERALRDPSAPARLLAAYDSGDRLHPNDGGYEVLAGVVLAECGLR
jgi:lysophospholipase L1-like esterase